MALATRFETFDYFVEDVWVAYGSRPNAAAVLRGVGVGVNRGQITALLGASGGGKTTLARAMANLLPKRAHVEIGRARLPQKLGFVQQEAGASLHPLRPVGMQIEDIIAARRHRGKRSRTTRYETLRLFEEIGLQPVERYYREFAHRLSGGQKQRVAIARAIAAEAELVIADEPTSQLDLITQADVMKVMYRTIRQHNKGLLLITHDLRLVAEVADWVAVLNGGELVEFGAVDVVWQAPQHPYTKELLGTWEPSGRRRVAERGAS